jgi:diaminopimelate epimerase
VIFWKYHGIGNDFILFEDLELNAPDGPEVVRRLCDRRTGIGADGVLYVRSDPHADAFMKVMNSDGSEAEMCGNGIRCVAKHLFDFAIAPSPRMTINTLGGVKDIEVKLTEGEVSDVTVDMGAPRLECSDIPMACEGRFIDRDIDVDGSVVRGTAVSMGNPHLVIFQDLPGDEIRRLGPLLHAHPLFPRKTNVEFVRLSPDHLDIAVYERGAGWTHACGTGACATVVAAGLNGVTRWGHDVRVHLPGGELTINVKKDLSMVRMTGPAARVFQGEIEP